MSKKEKSLFTLPSTITLLNAAAISSIFLYPWHDSNPPTFTPIISSEIKPPPTTEQIESMLQTAQEPYQMILSRLRTGSTRLVGLGEFHTDIEMENFGRDLILQAAQEGLINFVSLEIYSSLQTDMDNYLNGQIMSSSLRSVFSRHNRGYQQIVEVAKEYGLPVICSDNMGSYRDEFMSINTLIYMQEHPEHRGVFYAGNGHITEPNDLLPLHLGDSYYSVLQIKPTLRNDTIASAATQIGLTEPIGLENLHLSPLGVARWGFFTNQIYEYQHAVDAIVIHP